MFNEYSLKSLRRRQRAAPVMRTAIFYQSIVFLLGRVRNTAGSQGNAYEKQGSHLQNLSAIVLTRTVLFGLFLSHCKGV